MIPGGPRNQRQMELMMRRMGMRSEAIDGVEEVVLRTRTQEHVFQRPDVTVVTVQGITTYQVVGTPTVRPRGTTPAPAPSGGTSAPAGPPEEDVQLVMDQAQVDRPTAVEALFRARGAPAEAIMQLLTRGK